MNPSLHFVRYLGHLGRLDSHAGVIQDDKAVKEELKKEKERHASFGVLSIDPFVCLPGWLFVCLSVCLRKRGITALTRRTGTTVLN